MDDDADRTHSPSSDLISYPAGRAALRWFISLTPYYSPRTAACHMPYGTPIFESRSCAFRTGKDQGREVHKGHQEQTRDTKGKEKISLVLLPVHSPGCPAASEPTYMACSRLRPTCLVAWSNISAIFELLSRAHWNTQRLEKRMYEFEDYSQRAQTQKYLSNLSPAFSFFFFPRAIRITFLLPTVYLPTYVCCVAADVWGPPQRMPGLHRRYCTLAACMLAGWLKAGRGGGCGGAALAIARRRPAPGEDKDEKRTDDR